MYLDLNYSNFVGEAALQKEEVKRFDPVAELELKTEQDFVYSLTDALAKIYSGISEPLYLRVYEFQNKAQYPTWEIMVTNKEYAKRLEIFRTVGEKHLFTTSLHQPYIALHSKDPVENYGGSLGVELMMFGSQSGDDRHWKEDSRAEAMAYLTLIEYQRKIAQFYPEWTTHYIDVPLIKSWQIIGLEQ